MIASVPVVQATLDEPGIWDETVHVQEEAKYNQLCHVLDKPRAQGHKAPCNGHS